MIKLDASGKLQLLTNKQKTVCRVSHPEVPRKRCSENMPQVYRGTLMSMSDFNKAAKQRN